MPQKDPEKQKQYNKEYHKKYYQKNKKKKIAQAKRSNQMARKRNVELVSSYKKEKGCSICNENRPWCLDLHHLKDKKKSISKMANKGWGWKTILKEIEKCQVLCRNCHANLHYIENGR